MVLALPLIIIGNAFEETVKEEERYKRERKKRMEMKLLERAAAAVRLVFIAQLAAEQN
jgi:hypothetical protein